MSANHPQAREQRQKGCDHPGPKAPGAQLCVDCFFANTTNVERSQQWCSRCKKDGHSAWYCDAPASEKRRV
jgi:hypothetical protein